MSNFWDVAINDRVLRKGEEFLQNNIGVRLGPAAMSELFRVMWRESDQSRASPPVDLSRCGIQDGCDSRARCVAEGLCRYTGSPLTPTPPLTVEQRVERLEKILRDISEPSLHNTSSSEPRNGAQ